MASESLEGWVRFVGSARRTKSVTVGAETYRLHVWRVDWRWYWCVESCGETERRIVRESGRELSCGTMRRAQIAAWGSLRGMLPREDDHAR